MKIYVSSRQEPAFSILAYNIHILTIYFHYKLFSIGNHRLKYTIVQHEN